VSDAADIAGSGAQAASTTDDAFLGDALRILQPATGYRAGLDGVLLAAAIAAGDGDSVLDAGSGVGVAGLAVARRLPHVRVTMVERDPLLARLARSNIVRNDLLARVGVVEADVTRPLGESAALLPMADSFHHVAANPPYHTEGHGTPSGDPVKAAANALPEGALERWMRFLAAMARPGGTVTLIHRAEALQEILAAMCKRFGGAVVLPIRPREGQSASRVLVQAVKGSRAPLELRPGLVLHDGGHGFRPEVEAILRRGAPLALRKVSGGP
jgi:tRNA1(Val) A37 N6-methylase TrmN6